MIQTISVIECENCDAIVAGPDARREVEVRATGPAFFGADDEYTEEFHETVGDDPAERNQQLAELSYEEAKQQYEEWERERLETERAEWRTEVEADRSDVAERVASVSDPEETVKTNKQGAEVPVITYTVERHEAVVTDDTNGEIRCPECDATLVDYDLADGEGGEA